MSKSGRYLLTGILAIMLVIAPLRAVMALPMGSSELCASMSDHGGDLQHGQASTTPDSEHSSQTHGCCDDADNACTTDCQASTSQSYAPVSTSAAKTPRQYFLISGLKASAVPIRHITPLLRPPATLHS